MKISKNDINFALAPSPWDFGNNVLYSLCRKYSEHNQDNAIIAKIWLIGRSYAAAIERRKNADDISDGFYEKTVVKKIKNSKIDLWMSSLPKRMKDPWLELGSIITVHKKLCNLFFDLTGLEKRSLASKYLHFHRPDLFFLYDSRAKESICKITPRLMNIPEINAMEFDSEYLAFCRRAQFITDFINERFDKKLTPRQLDKILLRKANESWRAYKRKS